MLATKIAAIATIVSKIEDMDIHVIDAAASQFSTPNLGARISVRGASPALAAITNTLADSVVDPIRRAGRIERPLLVTNVVIDGVTVHLSSISEKD